MTDISAIVVARPVPGGTRVAVRGSTRLSGLRRPLTPLLARQARTLWHQRLGDFKTWIEFPDDTRKDRS